VLLTETRQSHSQRLPRIMSSEYKKNDGKATDWSKRAQSAADRNEYWGQQSGSQQESESGGWCVIL
jgi:hypothetical protein